MGNELAICFCLGENEVHEYSCYSLVDKLPGFSVIDLKFITKLIV
jgi:hypothetical protein